MSNELRVWRARPLGNNLDYVVRCHRDAGQVAELFRRHEVASLAATFASPDFPADRARQIIYAFHRDTQAFSSAAYLLQEAPAPVVDRFMHEHLPELLDDLAGIDVLRKVSAGSALCALAYDLPPAARKTVLQHINSIPKSLKIGPRYYLDCSALPLQARLKIKSLDVAERLHAIAGSEIGQSHTARHLEDFVTRNLQSFPPRYDDGFLIDDGERSDYQSGQASTILRSLVRCPDITEDEIQRVSASQYCANPYGEPKPYRTVRVSRGTREYSYQMLGPANIPGEMKNLVDWVNSERARRLPPLVRAALFIARFDPIHPFEDRTKHAGRFFAAKILLSGPKEEQMLPLIGDSFFAFAGIYTQTAADSFPSATWSFGRSEPSSLLDLARDKRLAEFVFNFILNYFGKFSFCYDDVLKDSINSARLREAARWLLSEISREQTLPYFLNPDLA